MEKLDGHIFTPIILLLLVAIATMYFGIQALIAYGLFATATMLIITFLMYMEAAFGFKPLDKFFSAKKKQQAPIAQNQTIVV